MTVTFKDNYLRPATPTLILPDSEPSEGFRESAGWRSPIDDTAVDLLNAVARAGWDIPGIDVEVDTYGDAMSPIMCVRKISGGEPGSKWSVYFARQQYSRVNWNVLTLPSTVKTPGWDFTIFCDRSGPSLTVYVGDNYLRDEDRFLHGSKVNSKLHAESKIYLKYKNESYRGHGNMIVDNDLGREYDAEGDEPTVIRWRDMYGQAIDFLTPIIERIKALPKAEGCPRERLLAMAKVVEIPVSAGVPTLFCFDRHYGRRDSEIIVDGNGQRLCNLGISQKPESFPELAYEGFSYAFDPLSGHDGNDTWIGETSRDRDISVAKISLKYANDVYVVDEQVYIDIREAAAKAAEAEGRDRYTDAEVDLFKAKLANTIVSLSEYKGDYAKPVYLIHRPLTADEAEDVTEKVMTKSADRPYRYDVDLSAA